MEKLKHVNLDAIASRENLGRSHMKSEDLSELMVSMKKNGLITPIALLEENQEGTKFRVVAGHRRFRAAKKLGWKTIQAQIYGFNELNSATEHVLSLVENMHRVEPSLFDRGRLFGQLSALGLTNKEIGARLGITDAQVYETLDCANIFTEEQQRLIVVKKPGKKVAGTGKIGFTVAAAIAAASRSYPISRDQAREVLAEAIKRDARQIDVKRVVSLVSTGTDIEDAFNSNNAVYRFCVNIPMRASVAEKLRKKYGRSLSAFFVDRISADPSYADFGFLQNVKQERAPRRMSSGSKTQPQPTYTA